MVQATLRQVLVLCDAHCTRTRRCAEEQVLDTCESWMHLRGDWIEKGLKDRTACGRLGLNVTYIKLEGWPEDGVGCKRCKNAFYKERSGR